MLNGENVNLMLEFLFIVFKVPYLSVIRHGLFPLQNNLRDLDMAYKMAVLELLLQKSERSRSIL